LRQSRVPLSLVVDRGNRRIPNMGDGYISNAL
jgi:hypothetical protein